MRRLRSDEIPDARVDARFGPLRHQVVTDEEGYFRAELAVDEPLSPGWHDVELTLVASMAGSGEKELQSRSRFAGPTTSELT